MFQENTISFLGRKKTPPLSSLFLRQTILFFKHAQGTIKWTSTPRKKILFVPERENLNPYFFSKIALGIFSDPTVFKILSVSFFVKIRENSVVGLNQISYYRVYWLYSPFQVRNSRFFKLDKFKKQISQIPLFFFR